MRAMIATRPIGLLSALAAVFALGFAWVLQNWVGLAPCALCLVERWPYRAVVVLGVIAAVLPRGAARAVLALILLAILADVAIAFVHVGVEQHAWPSPLPECAAPSFGGGSVADMLKAMPAHPAKPCDAANYLIPGVKFSLAAMNLLYGVVFAAAMGGALWCGRRQNP
jgi:disulfide bond formation protein DsbB